VLVAATVVPSAPVLVPALAPGAPEPVVALRQVCAQAVIQLVDLVEHVVVVTAAAAGRWGSEAGGSLASYGVDLRGGGGQLILPPALTLGAVLLDDASHGGDRTYVAVDPTTTSDVCASLGRELVGAHKSDPPTGLLVLADGSAKRGEQAPGFVDARANDFDAAVATALATGDASALRALDPDVAEQLWVSGRVGWQVLAGVAEAWQASSRVFAGVTYDAAPLGVGYLVAAWQLAGPPDPPCTR